MEKQKKYDRELNLNSIKLYRESGKKMEEVARNLGMPNSTFYLQFQEFKEHGEDRFPGSGKLKPCNKELYCLKKHLAEVTMQRDVLKKAAAIFLKPKG